MQARAIGGLKAVLWDFGGVITTSPFEAFERFELANGYPRGFIRGVNATHPDTNAWARLERGEMSLAEFDRSFDAEARAAGHPLPGRLVLELLGGEVRPEMVEALRRCRARFTVACLTNNFVRADGGDPDPAPQGASGGPDPGSAGGGEQARAQRWEAERARRQQASAEVLALFHAIFESSRLGVRKPQPAFYGHALRELGIAAHEAVFLDDLGVNLKPARELGMHTIKVVSAEQALGELEAALGIPLRV